MTDPDVQAVAAELLAAELPPQAQVEADVFAIASAQVAVDAYRRQVLASRPDAERLPLAEELMEDRTETIGCLLAALADETAARQAAEADRDLLVRVRDEAVGKTADYAEVIRRVRDRLDALAEGELAHRSPDYGRGVAQAVREIRAVLDGAADPAVDEEETLTEALSADHWA